MWAWCHCGEIILTSCYVLQAQQSLSFNLDQWSSHYSLWNWNHDIIECIRYALLYCIKYWINSLQQLSFAKSYSQQCSLLSAIPALEFWGNNPGSQPGYCAMAVCWSIWDIWVNTLDIAPLILHCPPLFSYCLHNWLPGPKLECVPPYWYLWRLF